VISNLALITSGNRWQVLGTFYSYFGGVLALGT
jgi:hypothetical protein